ncbi:uncharacterized protein LOC143001458 [Genypterus blacodes]|uniref:uncharacterized protein LOC143001458 n=1 Tax=Genypterus blacodes TaxID=154954 RepID=UPI003F75E264
MPEHISYGDFNLLSPVKVQQRTETNTTCSSWKTQDVKGLIFLLLFVIKPSLTSASPVGQRGSSSVAMVVKCVSPGCAAQVKDIFCDNENMGFDHSNIPQCTDVPAPKTTCQSDGLAYFSMDRNCICEFEGNSHINTTTLSDIGAVSAMLKAKSTPDNGRTRTGLIVCLGVLGVIVIAAMIWLAYRYLKQYFLPVLQSLDDSGERSASIKGTT